MSKIGKQPVTIPNGVTVEVVGSTVNVSGPKGKLSQKLADGVIAKAEGNEVLVTVKRADKKHLSNWGTYRMLLANMVKGVSEGWSKKLELIGTGYRAEARGNLLVLTVGYSHPVEITAPEGITFKVEKNIITVEGIDRAVVGQISANIRASRPPEPYKGKGVKYTDEVLRRKAGKAAKAAA
jgi:large subunit ribosomal protein L6